MEVKVQYVVELEEIPKEITGLLPDCEDYENRICNLGRFVEEHSFSLALDEIESIRKSMYKVDQRLSDWQAILKGYLNVKNRPKEQPQQENDFDLEQLKGLASLMQREEQGVENDPAS